MTTTPTDARSLPLVPTTGVVLPEMVVTIRLESEEARVAVGAASNTDEHVVLVPRRDGADSAVGTIARIEQQGPLPDGAPGLVVRGLARASVGQGRLADDGALLVAVTEIEYSAPNEVIHDLASAYRVAATRLLTAVGGSRMARLLNDVVDPGVLADTIAWWPDLSDERRLELLETTDIDRRLELATEWASEAAVEAEVVGGINRDVGDDFDRAQREAVLRRQLATIRRELGDGDDDVVTEYRARVDELGDDLTESVRSAVGKEIDRLERTGEQGQEAS